MSTYTAVDQACCPRRSAAKQEVRKGTGSDHVFARQRRLQNCTAFGLNRRAGPWRSHQHCSKLASANAWILQMPLPLRASVADRFRSLPVGHDHTSYRILIGIGAVHAVRCQVQHAWFSKQDSLLTSSSAVW